MSFPVRDNSGPEHSSEYVVLFVYVAVNSWFNVCWT
jgi:hypothetical protein